MEFRYEITVDAYVAGQNLYRKLAKHGTVISPVMWILVGLLFFVVALTEPMSGGSTLILIGAGVFLIYFGLLNVFPGLYLRRAYRKSGLAGRFYHAELDAQGFRVTGDDCGWQAHWRAVSVKGEDELVFVFYAANTIFIFGKEYFTPEKQDEIRSLAGLASPSSGAVPRSSRSSAASPAETEPR